MVTLSAFLLVGTEIRRQNIKQKCLQTYKLSSYKLTCTVKHTQRGVIFNIRPPVRGGGVFRKQIGKKKLFLTIYIYLSRQLSGADCEVKESYTDKSFYLVWSTINKVLFINVQNNGSVLSIHKYFPWNKVIFGVI